MKAAEAVGRNPGAATPILVQSILAIAFAEAIVFYAVFLVAVTIDGSGVGGGRYARRLTRVCCHDMSCVDDAGDDEGRVAGIASTFGVSWPHLTAQVDQLRHCLRHSVLCWPTSRFSECSTSAASRSRRGWPTRKRSTRRSRESRRSGRA